MTCAGSGEEAEAILRKAAPPYQLVLTDLVMPGRTGMHVLRTALDQNPSCTVLVLSGYGTLKQATEAMDKGAYGLVNKPLQLEAFRQTLRRIVERINLIVERDALKAKVRELAKRVGAMETLQGRMEMLAQVIDPGTRRAGAQGFQETAGAGGPAQQGQAFGRRVRVGQEDVPVPMAILRPWVIPALVLACGTAGAVPQPPAPARATDAEIEALAKSAMASQDPKWQAQVLERLQDHHFRSSVAKERELTLFVQGMLQDRLGRLAQAAVTFHTLERTGPGPPTWRRARWSWARRPWSTSVTWRPNPACTGPWPPTSRPNPSAGPRSSCSGAWRSRGAPRKGRPS